MTIFGGAAGGPSGGYQNDLWVLSNANGLGGTPTWTQLFPTGGPPAAREENTAVYDAANNRMTIFGGSSTGSEVLNDVWVLSNANGLGGTPVWTQLSPTGSNSTIARAGHTAIYDNTNNRMTIFGGNKAPSVLNDVWVLSNANGLGGIPAWTQLSPNHDPLYGLPTTRLWHTAIYDTTNNRMTIFGGYDDGSYPGGFPNDVWVLSNADSILTSIENWELLDNKIE